MMRSAMVGAVSVLPGCTPSKEEVSTAGLPAAASAAPAPAPPPLADDLDVVNFDTTVSAMAPTAREMNSKYKETSEGGLAVSVVLC
jgi:hypothetical protein